MVIRAFREALEPWILFLGTLVVLIPLGLGDMLGPIRTLGHTICFSLAICLDVAIVLIADAIVPAILACSTIGFGSTVSCHGLDCARRRFQIHYSMSCLVIAIGFGSPIIFGPAIPALVTTISGVAIKIFPEIDFGVTILLYTATHFGAVISANFERNLFPRIHLGPFWVL